MRCPKCRKAIAIDSTSHAAPCGWKAATTPTPRSRQPGEDDEAPAGAVPPPPREPRVWRDVLGTFKRLTTKPRPSPIEHWRAVAARKETLPHIREQALAAIAELERRPRTTAALNRISDGVRLQEQAREVTREQLEREAREREAFTRRVGLDPYAVLAPQSVDKPERRPAPASGKVVDTPPMRDAKPAPSTPPARFSREDMPPDPLEVEAQAERAADPRRSGAPASRGTSRAGGSQRPNRSGYARARRT